MKKSIQRSLPLTLAMLVAACDGTQQAAPAAAASSAVAQVAGIQPTAASDLPPASANGEGVKCNIESLQGQEFETGMPQVARNASVDVVGWYIAGTEGAAGSGLSLLIHDTSFARQWKLALTQRTRRPDVAKAHGVLQDAGFKASLNLSGLPAGQYGMYLQDGRGAAGVCGLGRTFMLR